MIKDIEKRKAAKRAWYLKKKQDPKWVEATLEKGRKYKKENKPKINSQRKQYRKDNPWVNFYNRAWDRCNNPNHDNYERYGGKGIKFLFKHHHELKEIWIRDEAWKLKKPSLDRIDPKGHYCKENCRFIEWIDNIKVGWFKKKADRLIGVSANR